MNRPILCRLGLHSPDRDKYVRVQRRCGRHKWARNYIVCRRCGRLVYSMKKMEVPK